MNIHEIQDDLEKNLLDLSSIKDAISVIADSLGEEADFIAAGRALHFLAELMEERTDSLETMLFPNSK